MTDPAPRPVRARRPLAAHAWFPSLVALWCAAALGLSSLVVAPAMLETLVAASGIDRVVSAAAPPLGQTARGLLALGLAGLGGLAGLLFGLALAARARRDVANVAEANDDPSAAVVPRHDPPSDEIPLLRSRDRHPDAPARRPLSASVDLAADDEVPGEPETFEDVVEENTPRKPALAGVPLDSLGLAQLTERLALAMVERRERDGGSPRPVPLALPPFQRAAGNR